MASFCPQGWPVSSAARSRSAQKASRLSPEQRPSPAAKPAMYSVLPSRSGEYSRSATWARSWASARASKAGTQPGRSRGPERRAVSGRSERRAAWRLPRGGSGFSMKVSAPAARAAGPAPGSPETATRAGPRPRTRARRSVSSRRSPDPSGQPRIDDDDPGPKALQVPVRGAQRIGAAAARAAFSQHQAQRLAREAAVLDNQDGLAQQRPGPGWAEGRSSCRQSGRSWQAPRFSGAQARRKPDNARLTQGGCGAVPLARKGFDRQGGAASEE